MFLYALNLEYEILRQGNNYNDNILFTICHDYLILRLF